MTPEQIVAVAAGILGPSGLAGILAIIWNAKKKTDADPAPPTRDEVVKATAVANAEAAGVVITEAQWGQLFAQQARDFEAKLARQAAEFEAKLARQAADFAEQLAVERRRREDLEGDRESDRGFIRSVVPWATLHGYTLPVPVPPWYGAPTTKENPA